MLVLTTFDLDEYVYGALRAGASGFLLKDTPRRLIRAIHTLAPGTRFSPPRSPGGWSPVRAPAAIRRPEPRLTASPTARATCCT